MLKTYLKKSASSYLFLVVSVASLLLFWQLGLAVASGSLVPVDERVAAWVVSHRISFFTPFVVAITNFGDLYVVVLLLVLLFALLIERRASFKILLVYFSVQLAFTASELAKAAVASSRPFAMLVPTMGFGFPSGHATVATAFLLSLLYVLWPEAKDRRTRLWFACSTVALIFLVAASRVYLGVHWISDSLGGMLLGLFAFSFIAYIYKKIAILYKWHHRLLRAR